MIFTITLILILWSFADNEALYELIGAENVDKIKTNGRDGLKHCFSVLMHSKDSDINSCIAKLKESFKTNGKPNFSVPITRDHLTVLYFQSVEPTLDRTIFLQLNEQFPNDVGSLSLFFLNVIQLEPGQAIFLPAKEPHAYLSGDCIECMACSDNVVRGM